MMRSYIHETVFPRLLEEAKTHIENKSYSRAISTLSRILILNPNDPKALFQRGMAYYHLFKMYFRTYDDLHIFESTPVVNNCRVAELLVRKLSLAKADLEKAQSISGQLHIPTYHYLFKVKYELLQFELGNQRQRSDSIIEFLNNQSAALTNLLENHPLKLNERLELLLCRASVNTELFGMGEVDSKSVVYDFNQIFSINCNYASALEKFIDFVNPHQDELIQSLKKYFVFTNLDNLELNVINSLNQEQIDVFIEMICNLTNKVDAMGTLHTIAHDLKEAGFYAKAYLFFNQLYKIEGLEKGDGNQIALVRMWMNKVVMKLMNKDLDAFQALLDFENTCQERHKRNFLNRLGVSVLANFEAFAENCDRHDACNLLADSYSILWTICWISHDFTLNFTEFFCDKLEKIVDRLISSTLDPVIIEYLSRIIVNIKNDFGNNGHAASPLLNQRLSTQLLLCMIKADYLPQKYDEWSDPAYLNVNQYNIVIPLIKNLSNELYNPDNRRENIVAIRFELAKYYLTQQQTEIFEYYKYLIGNSLNYKLAVDFFDLQIVNAHTQKNQLEKFKLICDSATPSLMLYIFEYLISNKYLKLAELVKNKLNSLNSEGNLSMLEQEQLPKLIELHNDAVRSEQYKCAVNNNKFSDAIFLFYQQPTVERGTKRKDPPENNDLSFDPIADTVTSHTTVAKKKARF